MRDPLMAAEHAAGKIDDVARLHRIRPQPADDVGVAAGRHEANILAILLVGDFQAKAARQFANFGLAHVAERKSQETELLARGRKQEIALVAIAIRRAMQRTRAVVQAARGDVVAGGKCRGAKVARRRKEIAELDGAIALDAGHRRLAMGVAVGEIVDH